VPKNARKVRETDSDAALERWQERLQPTPVKAALNESRNERRPERPRTVQEAADELGLSVHTIRAWIASRRLGYLRLGRAIRIPAAEIRKVIERSTVPPVQEE
jgi:excisionase family DNA binding protein